MVIGANIAGVTQQTIDDRFAKTASNTALENLQTVGMVYWMLHDIGDQLAAAAHDVATVRLPSLGAFGAPLVTRYFFGIPRSASYVGRYADVKQVSLAATANDGQVPVAFMHQIGLQGSNFEGLAFDMTFNREAGSGGSAVRFINRARESGAAVLRITGENQAVLGALTISEDVKNDIRNTVNAGKEAYVPDQEFTNGSWSGLGYILFDPATGAGAYLIDGGYNGGTDDPGCGETGAAPATQTAEKPNMGFYAMFALAVIAILAAPHVLKFVGVMLMTTTVAMAAPGPGGGLPANLQQIWQSTFGRAYGQFPSGPNYPGNGIEPPGNCSKDQLKALEQKKAELCDDAQKYPKRCDEKKCKSSEVIEQKISNHNACIEKRLEIMFTCFKGGDGIHWGKIEDGLKGLNRCQNCLAKALNQCSP